MSRIALTVHGVVQGVGFRPFVRRAALTHNLTGWVRNGRDGVRIEVQGNDHALNRFMQVLEHELPSPARITALDRRAVDEVDDAAFSIVTSRDDAPAEAVLPADLATCDACLAELRDPRDRRHRYPFTNCTHCGPRYSITERLPYDRPNTTMRRFTLCEACAREYRDLDDRRYHAQPIACPSCGPELVAVSPTGQKLAQGDKVLTLAAHSLRRGEVVALRGLGGYQLLVDARRDAALRRLRECKRRPDKPFAVMFGSLEQLAACARVSRDEARVLSGPEAPIVLLARVAGDPLAAAVHCDSPWLGAMLPTTPLHHLLLDEVGVPLVCTSGNLQDEPICTESGEALERLGPLVAILVDHDRPIARPVDDSVVRVTNRAVRVVRRARGYAPLPVAHLQGTATLIGLGAHLNSTVALSHRGQLLVSQHLCDLDTPRARDLLAATARDLCDFYDTTPQAIACDLHPDYASTQLAERLAARHDIPLLRVQHHHAHVAAVMAEHELEGEVLGLAFDGTGYGADGTIWGGEALACSGDNYRRVAHLGTFRLPGGERAMRSPRRAALGLLASARPAALGRADRWFQKDELRVMRRALERGLNSPVCSSIGRLFDAVAALLGLLHECSFEGQAALALEASATRCRAPVTAYPLPLVDGASGAAQGALGPLVERIVRDLDAGVDADVIALRFHLALVEFG